MSIPRTKLIAAVTALGLGLCGGDAGDRRSSAPQRQAAVGWSYRGRPPRRARRSRHARRRFARSLEVARHQVKRAQRSRAGDPGGPAAIRRPSRLAPRAPRSTRSAPASRVATQAPSQRMAATAASTSSTTAPGPRSAGRGTPPPPRGRAGLSRRAALCPRRLESLADLRLTEPARSRVLGLGGGLPMITQWT